ncbi:Clavaminate synthase-like protein [Terfezia boudieri ATCC MYA-4762]|uniref:Clavaminate synthase-like protein n=1 Tax=Terfezia boudieri ATCC MYA-4762 TaxID=1051890 RepID=A0A3N4LCK9_9PEZI|nr:Clavaminate synthase-like protein [Terfezia boudieri ATCC MYA-4762]
MPGPLAWDKYDLSQETYVHNLTPEQIKECEESMRAFKTSKKHLGYIAQETFPLPAFGPILRQRSQEVHNVFGVLIVRGLVPAHYSPDEYIILHAGISSWIGSKRGVQTGNASDPEERYVIMHVTDLDVKEDRYIATANTAVSMPFHTDSGDIISLAYRQLSQTGGEIRVASHWTVYNEMLKKYPKVIETMKELYPWDMVGNIPDRAFHGLLHETVDSHGNRQITMMSERRPFVGDKKCPRLDCLPDLTLEQNYALDVIQELAEDCSTSISLEVGDILFINNRAMFHARSSYVDHSRDPDLKRHVIRIVLRDAEYGWPIPEALEHRYKAMFDITESPEDERWGVSAFIWNSGAQHG